MTRPRCASPCSILAIITAIFGSAAPVSAFSPTSTRSCCTTFLNTATSNDVNTEVAAEAEWIALTEDDGVKMRTIAPPSDDISDAPSPSIGKDVTVEYIGSITSRDWSTDDVLAAWLPDMGLTPLAPELFKAFQIDGERLLDAKKFNDKFIFEGLGVVKDSKRANIALAVQDLRESEQSHPDGTVFDKNTEFTFRFGKGMTIAAFELALKDMKPGQTAELVARSDQAYGKLGLKSAGKVLVPPYATVKFELTLIEVK